MIYFNNIPLPQTVYFDRDLDISPSCLVDFPVLVGFHLSGTIKEAANPLYSEPEKVYQVSISFDR